MARSSIEPLRRRWTTPTTARCLPAGRHGDALPRDLGLAPGWSQLAEVDKPARRTAGRVQRTASPATSRSGASSSSSSGARECRLQSWNAVRSARGTTFGAPEATINGAGATAARCADERARAPGQRGVHPREAWGRRCPDGGAHEGYDCFTRTLKPAPARLLERPVKPPRRYHVLAVLALLLSCARLDLARRGSFTSSPPSSRRPAGCRRRHRARSSSSSGSSSASSAAAADEDDAAPPPPPPTYRLPRRTSGRAPTAGGGTPASACRPPAAGRPAVGTCSRPHARRRPAQQARAAAAAAPPSSS